MMTFSDLATVPSDPPAPFTDRPRLALAAYLARFKGWWRPESGVKGTGAVPVHGDVRQWQ
jgi:hypothetical protein